MDARGLVPFVLEHLAAWDTSARHQFWVDLLFHNEKDLAFIEKATRRIQAFNRVTAGDVVLDDIRLQAEAVESFDANMFAMSLNNSLRQLDEHEKKLHHAEEVRQIMQYQQSEVDDAIKALKKTTNEVMTLGHRAIHIQEESVPEEQRRKKQRNLVIVSDEIACAELLERAAAHKTLSYTFNDVDSETLLHSLSTAAEGHLLDGIGIVIHASADTLRFTPGGTFENGVKILATLRSFINCQLSVSGDIMSCPDDYSFDSRALENLSDAATLFFNSEMLLHWRNVTGFYQRTVESVRRSIQSHVGTRGDVPQYMLSRMVTDAMGWDKTIALLDTLRPIKEWLDDVSCLPGTFNEEEAFDMLRCRIDERMSQIVTSSHGERAPPTRRKSRLELEQDAEERARKAIADVRNGMTAKTRLLFEVSQRLGDAIMMQNDVDDFDATVLEEIYGLLDDVENIPVLELLDEIDQGGTLQYGGDPLEALPDTASSVMHGSALSQFSEPISLTLQDIWDSLIAGEEAFVTQLDLVHKMYALPIATYIRDGGVTDDMLTQVMGVATPHLEAIKLLPAPIMSDDYRQTDPVYPHLMSLEDFISVFWDTLRIGELHAAILEDLHATQEETVEFRSIDVICEGIKRAKSLYSTWLTHFPQSLATLEQCLGSSHPLRCFFGRVETMLLSCFHGKLINLMRLPLQRTNYYTWMLTRLLQRSSQPRDRKQLQAALIHLHQIREQAATLRALLVTEDSAAESCDRSVSHPPTLMLDASSGDIVRQSRFTSVEGDALTLVLTTTSLIVFSVWEVARGLGDHVVTHSELRHVLPLSRLDRVVLIMRQLDHALALEQLVLEVYVDEEAEPLIGVCSKQLALLDVWQRALSKEVERRLEHTRSNI